MNRSNAQEKDDVTVVNIFGANLKLCDAVDCGPGRTEEELTESVRLGLAQRFGDRVRVEYHSLRDPEVVKQYGEILAKGRALGIPLPLVVVDDSIIQGGGIDYRHIVNAIDLKSEVGG